MGMGQNWVPQFFSMVHTKHRRTMTDTYVNLWVFQVFLILTHSHHSHIIRGDFVPFTSRGMIGMHPEVEKLIGGRCFCPSTGGLELI